MTTQRAYSPMHTITTTAAREVQILLMKKGVIATLAILLLAVVGLIGFGTWQKNKEDAPEATAVAAVGVDTQLLSGSGYEPRAAADRDEAMRMVRDGDVDAALVADGDQWQVISDGTPSVSVMSGMESLAESYTRSETLATLGISPEDYDAASRTIDVVPVDVDDATGGEDTEQHFVRLLTTFAALMMVIFTVITFAAQVGSRVTEEKSSRVVELVLATVRPLDFLAGKLLGTLILGFIATALLLAVGGVGLKVSGLVDDVELDWSVFPVLLLAWLLSMLFFGALYAAAGAMVQRTEDLQSTQMPILVLIMASAYIPAFGWMSTSATWMQVMSWIPPFSIFAAPLSYAAGDFTALQLTGSFAIATLATVLAVWAAARIYERTILNNGSVTKWSQVLRRA
ncbi:ABC transporter permease [Corynebacterium mucifaciens]|uniref:ABC transporter permease n=1 Tax=Corynebacterium mucifaciens TaxID=57171 RepID=A0A7X6LP67_9CORY|nr:ABC transporter permease [Corynebacterium mucifaciens]NKY67776.1 ABC transporter permease [Corynebacterium mucifaciens]